MAILVKNVLDKNDINTIWKWNVVTANTTANVNEGYLVDTSSSAITITLPSSPSEGKCVMIKDIKSSASTNNITINRNGNNIEGEGADFIIAEDNRGITFVYSGSTDGWTRVSETYGPAIYA